MSSRELRADECRKVLPPDALRFRSTEEIPPLSGIASQQRAIQALQFGLEIQKPRFHVVVVGAPGTGRTFSARSLARRIAARRPTPDDILLLPNLTRPSEPTVLTLPAGEGRPFVQAMEKLHGKLVEALRGTTEGERFKQVRAKIRRRVNNEETRLTQEMKRLAADLGLELERTESEVQISPMEGSAEPSAEALAEVTGAIEDFETTLATVQEEADRELRATVKALLEDAARVCFAPERERYAERAEVDRFLGDLEGVVTRELHMIVDEPRGEEAPTLPRGIVIPTLLTEHEPGSGAPVVELAFPTFSTLFGRSHAPPDSDFPPEPGFAVAGALHQAHGGFLILPAAPLLKQELLYEQLKACLLSGRFLVPEHNPTYYRGTAEELLFPPMPLDLKVVLVASPGIYQELYDADPDFVQLFKVQARFEPTLPLGEALVTYPSFLAGIARDRDMPAFTPEAVAELIRFGGRVAESQTKATARLGLVAETATEAAYRAGQAGRTTVEGRDVITAIETAQRRGSYTRDQVFELLADGTLSLDVSGRRAGQVNAIAVLTEGPEVFGRPCRVTAVTYAGLEGPVNIAREVEMSGPIHSKGVMVLTGYLASRFAQSHPLSFGASLVFEQTYEAIDGDSASSSELYALLSALSGIPLRQDLAVTGAVDQRGSVLAVGAINEKIESFFDACVVKGLTGTQGVLIPTASAQQLMLRADVVAAIAEGRFHVYVIACVEDGIELLSGRPAGVADAHGNYPPGTVFAGVMAQLSRFRTALRQELSR